MARARRPILTLAERLLLKGRKRRQGGRILADDRFGPWGRPYLPPKEERVAMLSEIAGPGCSVPGAMLLSAHGFPPRNHRTIRWLEARGYITVGRTPGRVSAFGGRKRQSMAYITDAGRAFLEANL